MWCKRYKILMPKHLLICSVEDADGNQILLMSSSCTCVYRLWFLLSWFSTSLLISTPNQLLFLGLQKLWIDFSILGYQQYNFEIAGKGKKKSDNSGETSLSKNENGGHRSLGEASGEYRMPLVWIDLEMTGKLLFLDFWVVETWNRDGSFAWVDLNQTLQYLDSIVWNNTRMANHKKIRIGMPQGYNDKIIPPPSQIRTITFRDVTN